MGKNDGDIIDFMFKTIFSVFGWLFGILIKIITGLIGIIFKLCTKGIKKLFTKKGDSSPSDI